MSVYTRPIRSNELYHHGILGMHWGIRRYQNKDGSLTSAGRRRYGIGEKMQTNDPNDSATTQRTKSEYNTLSDDEFRRKYVFSKETYRKRVNKYGDPYMNSPLAKLGKELHRQGKIESEKNREIAQNNKALKKKNRDKKITEQISNTIEGCKKNFIIEQSAEYRTKYKNMSPEEAKALSEKKIQFLKKVAIGAGIAGAAVAGVAVSRYIGRTYIDDVIKAGTSIQTLSRDADRLTKGNSFFTAYKDADKKIYELMFGGAHNGGLGKYKNTAVVMGDTKVASRNSGKQVYEYLRKTNPEFEKLAAEIDTASEGIRRIGTSSRRLAYDRFNFYSLGTGDSKEITSKANKIFFDALKSKGYGAVADVNDMKYSTLRAQNPAIFFDKNKLDVFDTPGRVTSESRQAIKKEANKIYKRIMALDTLAYNPAFTAQVAGSMMISGIGYASLGYDGKVAIDQMKKNKKAV